MVYALDIQQDSMDHSIVHLEILNILVALTGWASNGKSTV